MARRTWVPGAAAAHWNCDARAHTVRAAYEPAALRNEEKRPGCGASRSKPLNSAPKRRPSVERARSSHAVRLPHHVPASEPQSSGSASTPGDTLRQVPHRSVIGRGCMALSCPRASAPRSAGGHQVHAPRGHENPSTWGVFCREARAAAKIRNEPCGAGDGRRRDVGGLPIS